jgi:hypothetical protein
MAWRQSSSRPVNQNSKLRGTPVSQAQEPLGMACLSGFFAGRTHASVHPVTSTSKHGCQTDQTMPVAIQAIVITGLALTPSMTLPWLRQSRGDVVTVCLPRAFAGPADAIIARATIRCSSPKT